jgi:hypothetical protein
MNSYADLDAVAVLAAAQDGVRRRREAGRDELLIALQWAVLHGESIRERDPLTTPGGEGTPGVREYALPELAIATQVHTMTVRHQVADALDLVHRLPLTWRRVLDLECEPWIARRVAALSRAVPRSTIAIVDRAVAAAIAGHTPSTVFEIAAAKVLEADPDAAAMAREHAARERYVRLSRADEQGFRHVIAKVTAGDAAWVDAMVARVADILALTLGGEHNHDELRSMAFGWLARPAELLELLLTHTEEAVDDEPLDDAARPAWATDRLDQIIGRLSAMSITQLKALRGAGATVFVHLDASALLDQHGVARVEAIGPVLVRALADLVGHADIRLQPVLDLHAGTRVDRYEHPDQVKDHTWLLTGGDTFPYTNRSATRSGVDFDHISPYREGGPPGQTSTTNAQPLRRTHHRWKTFGGYRARPAGAGRILWQTPHGLCALVDHQGTHLLTPHQTRIMLTAPDGIDLYVTGPAATLADDYRH